MEEFNRKKFVKDYKSAVIAKGLHNGEATTIKCIEFGDKQKIQVLLNDERNVNIEIDLESLMIKNAVDNEESAHFDSEPEIEVIGEIDTLGFPYDETDDSSVIY